MNENDNYNYEEGKYSTITFHWDDVNNKITISDREGSFPGMPDNHQFKIVLVNEKNGSGIYESKNVDKTIDYLGESVTVELK
jgi:alpha-D-xyloside xylohydrolase